MSAWFAHLGLGVRNLGRGVYSTTPTWAARIWGTVNSPGGLVMVGMVFRRAKGSQA